ncbi:iron-containing redox enzyme family protein [Amycolatopsis antarctica]|nr:iron-containing redox enzyme family protein [Amycolatopsis antarctica]
MLLRSLPEPAGSTPRFDTADVAGSDPFGDDLQLALYLCYELHYQGLAGVDDAWEWNLALLGLRAELEARFVEELRCRVAGGADTESALDALLVEPADAYGVSHHLRDSGQWRQVQELFVHRSAYHLKEADPHAWVIPRLRGRAKAAVVAVEYDEFGGGRAERMHSTLFANLMAESGLDTRYLAYLDAIPGTTLATVNVMSLFGLHRRHRGALVGHFAATEITTGPNAQRMETALRRMGAGPDVVLFYTEHIEADAVHEQVLREDVIGAVLEENPALAADVVFGIQASEYVEGRAAQRLLEAWRDGLSSLRPNDFYPVESPLVLDRGSFLR